MIDPIHPYAERMFPLDPELIGRLAGAMATDGYDGRFPIVLWQGQIVDGRHRAAAAAKAGLMPPAQHLPGEMTPVEVLRFVQRAKDRQDLTRDQRAMAAAYYAAELEKAIAAERVAELAARPPRGNVGGSNNVLASAALPGPGRGHKKPEGENRNARREAATLFDVSEDAVRRAKVVAEDKPLAAQVERGEIKLREGYKRAVGGQIVA